MMHPPAQTAHSANGSSPLRLWAGGLPCMDCLTSAHRDEVAAKLGDRFHGNINAYQSVSPVRPKSMSIPRVREQECQPLD